MTAALRHRGPDAGDVWIDADSGFAFGHRRLAIQDLSPAGAQPMVSRGGRWVIVFNGEIYNHKDLRRELESGGNAPEWRGHSDTETILALVEARGVRETVCRLAGMFAVALWDRKEKSLWLVRDRLGEKPLYFGWSGGSLLFASELKAMRRYRGFDARVSDTALAQFVRYSCVPAPYCIYDGIHKLPAGHIVHITAANIERSDLPESHAYWSAAESASHGRNQPFIGSESDAAQQLEVLLRDAVRRQMASDVPLGAFLSGGVDSSLVVALMQAQASRKVKTFSIGFHDARYNEAGYAASVADHLGTDHTEMYVSAEDAMAVIPQMPYVYDEPFADSSQIPTLLVSKLARRDVTVALSGDGGDELFGGYTRYVAAARIWRQLQMIPSPARQLLAGSVLAIPAPPLDLACRAAERLSGGKVSLSGERVHKAAAMITASSSNDFYSKLISHWGNSVLASAPFDEIGVGLDFSGTLTEKMMVQDSVRYLPDDILVKVDRAAMACGLETRVPFLDHRVFEFAWSLPLEFKVKGGSGKRILKKVLREYLPDTLIDRPKKGFAVPIGEWLRGPLREWAESLLDPTELLRDGYFVPSTVAAKWREHKSGVRNWQHHLWDILMFQAWLRSSSDRS